MTDREQEKLFSEWIRDYEGLFYKAARSFATEPADQDDLLQEILLQVWISIPKFEGRSKVSTWLYRIAFNTAVVWKRSKKRYKKHNLQCFEQAPQFDPMSDHSVDKQDVIEDLYKAIHTLPLVDASLVLLSLEGVPYKEMSEILGISESHVGVKLMRAREKLSEKLKGKIDE